MAVNTATSFEDNWAQVVFEQAKERSLGTPKMGDIWSFPVPFKRLKGLPQTIGKPEENPKMDDL